MIHVAGRTIKITKKQIQRRKLRDALLALFSALSNLLRRPRGAPASKPETVRIKAPRPGGNAANAAGRRPAAAGGVKVDTKVKNCPVCMTPFRDELPVVRCRVNTAHTVHQACLDLARGKCPLDGHALG